MRRAILGALLFAWGAPAVAQDVTAQGITYSLESASSGPGTFNSPGEVTAAGGPPIILQNRQGWNVNADLAGAFSVNSGLPQTSPVATAVVNLQSVGETNNDITSSTPGLAGGAVTVDDVGQVSASDVTGASGGAGGIFIQSIGADGFNPGGNATIPDDSNTQQAAFNGSNGSNVTTSLQNGASITVSGSGSRVDNGAFSPTTIGLSAAFVGGDGTDAYYYSSDREQQQVFFNGAAGAAVR